MTVNRRPQGPGTSGPSKCLRGSGPCHQAGPLTIFSFLGRTWGSADPKQPPLCQLSCNQVPLQHSLGAPREGAPKRSPLPRKPGREEGSGSFMLPGCKVLSSVLRRKTNLGQQGTFHTREPLTGPCTQRHNSQKCLCRASDSWILASASCPPARRATVTAAFSQGLSSPRSLANPGLHPFLPLPLLLLLLLVPLTPAGFSPESFPHVSGVGD